MPVTKWAVLSSGERPTADVTMIVMDPDHHEALSTKPGILKVASISVGEAGDNRSYWSRISDAPFLLEQDKEVEGQTLVDFRDPVWQRLITEEEIPRAIEQGFDGLLLDNLDSILYIEDKFPLKLSGQREALILWLSQLRLTYPDLLLLAKGSTALQLAAPYVDAYVSEGVHTVWDATTHKARRTTSEERDMRIKQIENASAIEFRPIFTIEVTDTHQPTLGSWAVEQSLRRGFRPFLKIR